MFCDELMDFTGSSCCTAPFSLRPPTVRGVHRFPTAYRSSTKGDKNSRAEGWIKQLCRHCESKFTSASDKRLLKGALVSQGSDATPAPYDPGPWPRLRRVPLVILDHVHHTAPRLGTNQYQERTGAEMRCSALPQKPGISHHVPLERQYAAPQHSPSTPTQLPLRNKPYNYTNPKP